MMQHIEILHIDPEFQALIHPLSPDELTHLEANIQAEGCRDPLVLWNGTIIDGHHRYSICTQHNVPFTTVEREFASRDEAKQWIIRNQFGRRNLSDYSRGELALQLEELLAAQAKARQGTRTDLHPNIVQNSAQSELPAHGRTRDQLAEIAGVSPDTIQRIKTIQAKADDTTKQQLRTGETSINDAYTRIREQEKAAKLDQNRLAKLDRMIEQSRPLDGTLGAFPLIYADPPWRYNDNTTDPTRVIENQYNTMSLDELCALDVPAITTNDCILFMWATNPLLYQAMQVLDAWGFTYQTNLVWVKDKIGMGYWFRQQHELLLVATKGTPPKAASADRVSSVFHAPRLEHSAKPLGMYDVLERIYPTLPKVELFARYAHPGWAVWGNEV